MTRPETELNNHILQLGWKEGSATPDRIENLLNRLTLKNKLKLAAVAIADTDLENPHDTDLFETAA